ncbi:MAG TPA: hypothetical protein VK817_24020 [Trebonia sp.]|nr:hypothetical protein [Trebonia sp.]
MHLLRTVGFARPGLAAVGVLAVLAMATGCSGSHGDSAAVRRSPASTAGGKGGAASVLVASTRRPAAPVSELSVTAPETLTTRFAASVLRSAPVVVVAAEKKADLAAAKRAARTAHAPVVLATAVTAGLAADVRKLRPRDVMVEGLSARRLAALLPGTHVVTSPKGLPATRDPATQRGVAVLMREPAQSPAASAITATAAAAGVAVVPVRGTDPRADAGTVQALARLKPGTVIAVGTGFGATALLSSRISVAKTGVQLPGGGQVMFPGRRLVALYGHPDTPGLGALGEQDLTASIARAKEMASEYKGLSRVPVVPAFEIIASVAEGSPGPDGDYSYETPVSMLEPWVKAATKAGMYVVLDLQPGRASLLSQAEAYQSLLRLPNVGLALDAEWKLQPGQVPLEQIGHVDIGEVNGVVSWLAALTARYHLPQKLLVLHQFQLQMIRDEQDLDTHNDDLAIVIHMDGQGAPAVKQQTWNSVTAAAPKGVFFGWKNFFVKDDPMLTPQETMRETPTPVMISYQ